jgi:hypothetical protein
MLDARGPNTYRFLPRDIRVSSSQLYRTIWKKDSQSPSRKSDVARCIPLKKELSSRSETMH